MTIPHYSQTTVDDNDISHAVIVFDYYQGGPLSEDNQTTGLYGWKAFISPGEPTGGGVPLSDDIADVFLTREEAISALRETEWDMLPVYAFIPGRLANHSGRDTMMEMAQPISNTEDTLFENHTFTVKKLGDHEIFVNFLGEYPPHGDVVHGLKSYSGEAADQLDTLLAQAQSDDIKIEILAKRTGVNPVMKPKSNDDCENLDSNVNTHQFEISNGFTIALSQAETSFGEIWWVNMMDREGLQIVFPGDDSVFTTPDEARSLIKDIYDFEMEYKQTPMP